MGWLQVKKRTASLSVVTIDVHAPAFFARSLVVARSRETSPLPPLVMKVEQAKLLDRPSRSLRSSH